MSLWANFTDGIVNFNSIYFIVMSLQLFQNQTIFQNQVPHFIFSLDDPEPF